MANPNYFTCTLGQATALGLTENEFKNIPELISHLATQYGDHPAVGFAVPPSSRSESQPWGQTLFTYADLEKGSTNLALHLKKRHGDRLTGSSTIALISPSTPEFLFTWLALMRLGLAVLLIAPQCQPLAIAHLCSTSDVDLLFHEEQYASLAQQAASSSTNASSSKTLEAIPLPFSAPTSLSLGTLLSTIPPSHEPFPSPDKHAIAYLHHTSGTSSGVPKPIPQSHQAGAGVLPRFTHSHPPPSTFTTTPLYHGGVADCFRTWTAGALIWLFPGRAPITARNVLSCLDAASASPAPKVGYFASVPYVLQSLASDDRGLIYLRNMSIVGVGGAALPAEVGDRLVAEGVNLISRFGSAECGFLMSSDREYGTDKDWQYLRAGEGAKFLTFEKQDGGDGEELLELVIGSDWPHMAKRNRKDGSFATADLFVRSTNGEGWRYHSRADSQLTLVTGKKFDPAPLENVIATSELLEDALIFGNGRPYPGVLLFRSGDGKQLSDDQLVDCVWATVSRLNKDSQSHARLLRKMLVPMPKLEKPLEKSSKGTIIRGAAEKRFIKEIEDAYTEVDDEGLNHVPDEEVLDVLKDRIQAATSRGSEVGDDADLFEYGVDSVAGMQIRSAIRQLTPPSKSGKTLPIDIVEDCGTVRRLAEYVIKVRRGEEVTKADDDETQLMLDLVEKYSSFDVVGNSERTQLTNSTKKPVNGYRSPDDDQEVVVLTGATGALGAHILDLYSYDDKVRKVYCLVRGADDHASRERVAKALEQKRLRPLNAEKVVILRSSLGEEDLGLGAEVYDRLTRESSIILHVAWSVNFRMRLRSFERDNIAGVTNLLKLAMRSSRPSAPRFGFCSSVASVLSCSMDPVPEMILHDPRTATALGYSKSKWVAEQLCDKASEQSKLLSGRIAVFRVGQLSGDSHRGVWNDKEAWPMMLSAVKVTGSLPDLRDEVLDWLPVDNAAEAIVQGLQGGSIPVGVGSIRAEAGQNGLEGPSIETPKWESTTSVVHIVNGQANPKWSQMLKWLQDEVQFEVVSPQQWVKQLEVCADEGKAGHPAFKLLELWKSAYGKEQRPLNDEGGGSKRKRFAMEKTKTRIEVLRDVQPIDREYVLRIWRWIDEHM